MFDPRHEDSLSKMAEDAIEALTDIGSTVRRWFKTKEETASAEMSDTTSYAILEYDNLSYTERRLITPSIESLILNLRSLVLVPFN